MEDTTKRRTTAVEDFFAEVDEAVDRLKSRVREWPCESEALRFAMEAGLDPQMSYTIADTAKYSGIDSQQLYAEEKAGRLSVITPKGQTRGKRIRVKEMDRWMDEYSS